jgi:hypothetical protein
MEKIIIFNPSDYRILFLLSAAIKADYTPTLAHELEHLWNAEEIIILNINPNEELAKANLHPDLDILLHCKSDKIQAWLNFPGELDSKNFSVQNILKYFSPQMEIDSLDLGDQKKWPDNPKIARYGKALRAAKVIAINKKNLTEYNELLLSNAYSLAEGRSNVSVDTFHVQYKRVLAVTEYCFNKISTKQQLIYLPQREIAFGYLDTVSDYLDFATLREKCLNNYPFLTIIQYRQEGKEYNWFLSKKQLNIRTIFQLPETDNEHEILIEYPHKKMIQYLQNSIEGISKK